MYALDRRPELEPRRRRTAPRYGCARLRSSCATRACGCQLNVSEELALEALAYRLQALLAAPG